MNDRLQYWIDLPSSADREERSFPVKELRGEEALSRPFRFEATFTNDGARLRHASLRRAPAILRIEHGTGHRQLAGLITEVAVAATRSGTPEVHVVIEPSFALLRHRTDIRVFRDRTVPEIVREVLGRASAGIDDRLTESYVIRPYTVQWRESDLDFAHRLLEDEGIFYFLSGERVVLCDHPGAYEPHPALDFRGGQGLVPGDAVTRFAERAELVPAKVSLRDFNHDKPSLDMDVHADVPAGAAAAAGVEWYEYPGEYALPDVGARRAKRRAACFQCASSRIDGDTTAHGVAPGARIQVRAAPMFLARDREGEIAITSVRHAYSRTHPEGPLAFEAISAEIPWQPPRDTPVPVLNNPLTGVVTGPRGHDVHTDSWGRVKVHFPWDRIQPKDDSSSHWVPVLQDNTGGSSAIPRVGWEVVVQFLEGDLDRPTILGRVYNGAAPFEVALPANKTISRLCSRSSPGRVGANTIEMEDLAGHEHVRVTAERDKKVAVANDKQQIVARDLQHGVGRNEAISIGSQHSASIGSHVTDHVGGDQTHTVAGSRHVKTGKTLSTAISGDRDAAIGAVHLRFIGGTDQVSAKRIEESVGGVVLEVARKGHSTQANRLGTLDAGGVHLELAGRDKIVDGGKRRGETVAGVYTSKATKVSVSVDKGKRHMRAGKLRAEAKREVKLIAEKSQSFEACHTIAHAEASLVMEVGTSKLVLKGGSLSLEAETIEIATVGTNELNTSASAQK